MFEVMTVFEASIKLYGWFSENDSFCMPNHYHSIMEAKGTHRNKDSEAALVCALTQFEKMDIVSQATVKDQKVWVLQRNFLTVDQTISLSADTCLSVAELINTFCEIIGNETDKCNPAEVNEDNIKGLIILCTYLIDKNKEEN